MIQIILFSGGDMILFPSSLLNLADQNYLIRIK